MSITYEEAIYKKEKLERDYKRIKALKKENRVDPNGPFYRFKLNDEVFNMLDDYANKNDKDFSHNDIVDFFDEEVFNNIDGKIVSNRDYIFDNKNSCKKYLLEIIDRLNKKVYLKETSDYSRIEFLLEVDFESLIKSDENSLDECKKNLELLKEEIQKTLNHTKAKNKYLKKSFERMIKKYDNNQELISNLENIKFFS